MSKLAQMIRKHGYNDFDRLEIATVTAAPPELRIKVDHMKIELDASDVIVSECLTDHDVTIVHSDGTRETVTFETGLRVGDRVIVSSANDGQKYVILDRF